MVSSVALRGDVEALEEETKILDIVGVVVVVDGEPENCVRVRIRISNNARCASSVEKE
jgi:hypothetical protein